MMIFIIITVACLGIFLVIYLLIKVVILLLLVWDASVLLQELTSLRIPLIKRNPDVRSVEQYL